MPLLSGRSRIAITLDVHNSDAPGDITFAARWLADAGIPATFFVPSVLFGRPEFAEHLRDLHSYGHEVGSHSHKHDTAETDALIEGARERLGFLRDSKQIFEAFYGRSPVSFRAPAWVALSSAATDELAALGYAVDSSSTPQRLSVFSSRPFGSSYLSAPRRVHFLRPGLLEIPTSALLVPAGSPTFLIFRQLFSVAFVRLLLWEARVGADRVVNLQFHPDEFNPDSVMYNRRSRLRASEFVLRRDGGLAFKHRLKCIRRVPIVRTTRAIISAVRDYGCATLAGFAADVARTRERITDAAAPTGSARP